MEKDYEIIQNISLAEKKEQEASEVTVAVPEVQVTPPGMEVPVPAVETPVVATPEIVVQPPVEAPAVVLPEVQLEVPGAAPEVSVVESVAPAVEVAAPVEEPVVVQPTYEEPVPEYSYGDNTSDNEYTSMFANTEVEVPAYDYNSGYENSYSNGYENSYDNSYETSSYAEEPVTDINVDVDYKDEASINRYYDLKTKKVVAEIEQERTAALDQCKRYNEMSTWVNEIGSSFNFFKGRKGY